MRRIRPGKTGHFDPIIKRSHLTREPHMVWVVYFDKARPAWRRGWKTTGPHFLQKRDRIQFFEHLHLAVSRLSDINFAVNWLAASPLNVAVHVIGSWQAAIGAHSGRSNVICIHQDLMVINSLGDIFSFRWKEWIWKRNTFSLSFRFHSHSHIGFSTLLFIIFGTAN